MLNVLIPARDSGPWVVEIAGKEQKEVSGGLLKIQKRGTADCKKGRRREALI